MTDCWKRRETISIHRLSCVSSFATVSSAHVRFGERGSMPWCLLGRRVREWRMRWHLHVSVCSLMTQRSFVFHTPLPLFFSLYSTILVFVILWTTWYPISSSSLALILIVFTNCPTFHFSLWHSLKFAVFIFKEISFCSWGSQAEQGFSLPHLTSQRFKCYEILSFSNKKTFWPAFSKFSGLGVNVD